MTASGTESSAMDRSKIETTTGVSIAAKYLVADAPSSTTARTATDGSSTSSCEAG
jgi:hypothetical protein